MIEFLASDHMNYLEEHIGLGIWEWRLKDDNIRWSSGLFRILGLNPALVVPSFELYKDVVHPDDRLDFDNNPAIASSGKLAHRKFRIIRPSGEMRWIESHGQLMFGPDGTANRMLGFALDVTEAQAGAITKTAFKALLHAVRVLTGSRVWQTAPNGTVVDEIDWWQSIDRSQTMGMHWFEQQLVHPDDLPAVLNAWTDANSKRSVYRATFRKRQQDGSYWPSSSVAVPVVGESGETLGWIGSSKPAESPSAVRALDASEIPAALFRGARAILDIGGDEFAALAGVSHSTIRRIESDNTGQVSLSIRQQVADFLALRGIRFTSDQSGACQISLSTSVNEGERHFD